MNLAISNIAWETHEEESARRLLQELGVSGVEIAPTKKWTNPLSASPADIGAYRDAWQKAGIEIVAMQSLLFGHPELTLFGSADARDQMLVYLEGMIRLGAGLGAKVLVFGSPKNRHRGEMEVHEAEWFAVPFFRKLGDLAESLGLVFCIEPNPLQYGCDFVTHSQEGVALVDKVQSSGFGLHLDSAAMTLAGENVAAVLADPYLRFCHFHLSAPNLETVGPGPVDHAGIAKALHARAYDQWLSIEMKAQSDNLTRVRGAIEFCKNTYKT